MGCAAASSFEDAWRMTDYDNKAKGLEQAIQAHPEWVKQTHKGFFNQTLLHSSAQSGTPQIAKVLLAHPSCDPGKSDDRGYTPLLNAVIYGHLQIAKDIISALKKKGTLDLNVTVSGKGDATKYDGYLEAALTYTGADESSQSMLEIIKLLVENGADTSKKYDDGSNVVARAAHALDEEQGSKVLVSVVKYLAAQPGVDLNAKDNQERTVFQAWASAACCGGNFDVLRALKGLGADTSGVSESYLDVFCDAKQKEEILKILA